MAHNLAKTIHTLFRSPEGISGLQKDSRSIEGANLRKIMPSPEVTNPLAQVMIIRRLLEQKAKRRRCRAKSSSRAAQHRNRLENAMSAPKLGPCSSSQNENLQKIVSMVSTLALAVYKHGSNPNSSPRCGTKSTVQHVELDCNTTM